MKPAVAWTMWAVWALLALYFVFGVYLAWGAVKSTALNPPAFPSDEEDQRWRVTLYVVTSSIVFLSGLALCVLHLMRTATPGRG
jgi:hypothetical protein